MKFKSIARVDRRTKDLAKRIKPHEIAIINHKDLDEVAAESLAIAKVKAVINAAPSISGRYPNLGPLVLADSGILIIDDVGNKIMEAIPDGQEIEIKDNEIYVDSKLIATGNILSREKILLLMEETKKNLCEVLSSFVDNTITYAQKETGLILNEFPLPEIKTKIAGRHSLIVVRGQNYKEDLKAIKPYIDEVNPVLIGVDGGADALVEFGYKPDMVVGDMDSISDKTLKSGAEIIVHAYPDGRAPGMERIESLGLGALTFPAPGTSEDIAMLLAYENGTELIVAVGTHSNMIDFLEKGRKGMASTFLVRMKVGSILVDAKGVNKLYKSAIKFSYVAQIIFAALIPIAVILLVSPSTQLLIRTLILRIKILFGIGI